MPGTRLLSLYMAVAAGKNEIQTDADKGLVLVEKSEPGVGESQGREDGGLLCSTEAFLLS